MAMLSRVAENLYWVARYLERAEDTARLVNVNTHLLLDFPQAANLGWATLIEITGSLDSFNELYDEFSERNVLAFLCTDRSYSSSLLSSLAAARENLRTTRDIVPREIWEQVNGLYMEAVAHASSSLALARREEFLKRIIRGCQTVTGLFEGTLSRTQAFTFVELGRQLERADMTTRIVDVRSGNLLPRNPEELTPFENLQWMSVLKSLTGYQMYRQQVRLRVRGPDVLEFLLKEPTFPRAVAYCLDSISDNLRTLPRYDRPLAASTLVRAEVAEADVRSLARSPDDLRLAIDKLQIGFNTLHDSIAATYFSRDLANAPPHQSQSQTQRDDMLDED
ncbi:alpha-E domain-containing protein [Halotalea alkalilenta]|nr:alpha-E domain-containing protein [Halotalea alkalilenta]